MENRYGIQELQDHKIVLPANIRLWPDQDRLLSRYNKFISVG